MPENKEAVDQAVALVRDLAADGGLFVQAWQNRAREIVAAIEPQVSADLLAARELAATVFERYAHRHVRVSAHLVYTSGIGAAVAIRAGAADDIAIVQDMLAAIERGRELAAEEHRKQRIADMAATPAPREVPGRLTITIDGPQGSGKTILADWLAGYGAFRLRRSFHPGTVVLPDIIEIRDGRRFDVRNEVFLDTGEED